ncbi:DUF3054 domain-containing protein [Halomicroarcula sp. GCM10025324]|uniref:DUF3054 domain-containing protein n=1 Tax=Haloarcula TaxID=2237 RepID=UPI0023E887AC|nr:DUF3054 domain-containing protein [Halomicroarcula sp. ZS-22-S1]
MSVSTVGSSRVELSSRTAALALGDVLAILVFVVAGEYSHGIDPFVNVGRVGGTVAPFLIGWGLVAIIGGFYASRSRLSPGRTLAATFVGWVLAVVVAQLLRATEVFHGDAALTFALVSTFVGGTLLCLWRVVATFIVSR